MGIEVPCPCPDSGKQNNTLESRYLDVELGIEHPIGGRLTGQLITLRSIKLNYIVKWGMFF